MKKLTFLASLMLPIYAQAAAIDIKTLNGHLKSLVNGYFKDSDEFAGASLWFDSGRTNFSDFQALANFTIKMNSTAWDFEPSELSGYAEVTSNSDSSGRLTQSGVKVLVRFKTDTVKYANFLLERAKDEFCKYRNSPDSTEIKYIFLSLACPRMKETSEFTEFADVQDFIKHLAALNLNAQAQLVKNLKNKIRTVSNDTEMAELDARIKRERKFLESLLTSSFQPVKDDADETIGIKLAITTKPAIPFGELKILSVPTFFHGLNIAVTEDEIAFSMAVSRRDRMGFYMAKIQFFVIPRLKDISVGDFNRTDEIVKFIERQLEPWKKWFVKGE